MLIYCCTLCNPKGEVNFLHNKDTGIRIKYTTTTGKDCSSTTALKKLKYFSAKYKKISGSSTLFKNAIVIHDRLGVTC